MQRNLFFGLTAGLLVVVAAPLFASSARSQDVCQPTQTRFNQASDVQSQQVLNGRSARWREARDQVLNK